MNLNEYMPTRLQDATPIDEKSMDLQMSADFNKAASQDQMIYRPNIRYGMTKKLQLEVDATLLSGSDEKDHGETQLGGLYQFNESDNYIPVFAWNPMVIFPTGKGGKALDFSQEIVLTSTLAGTSQKPKTQIHLNASWCRSSNLSIFGISQLLHERAALIMDILHEEDFEQDSESNSLEAGLHLGLGNEYYLSLGAGLGFGGKSQKWNGLLAFEKQIDHIFQ